MNVRKSFQTPSVRPAGFSTKTRHREQRARNDRYSATENSEILLFWKALIMESKDILCYNEKANGCFPVRKLRGEMCKS